METLIPQVQATALKHIMKAYCPSVSILFILKELGFSIDDADIEEGKMWLKIVVVSLAVMEVSF